MACVGLLGPRALPGRSFRWTPLGDMEWGELSDQWRRDLGAFDDVAGYTRLQASRTGLALLLLRKGSPIAFVKLRQGDSVNLSNEKLALEAVWSYRPKAFQVPEPLRSGSAVGWHYLATAPLPPGLHRPPRRAPLPAILEEVAAALAGLPRRRETPNHWRPMHGDFAPWNLRQLRGGSLALVDWEAAGCAPPGADAVFYAASWAALGIRLGAGWITAEPVRSGGERVGAHNPENARNYGLARGLDEVLGRR